MPATYSGDPSSSSVDMIRFLLGDTNVAQAKLQDDEIIFLFNEWQDEYLAAGAGADHLAANAAQWITFSADGNSLTLSEAQAKYSLMADALRAQYNRRNTTPFYAGGIDVGDRESFTNDDSVYHGNFFIGQHDNFYIRGEAGGATPEQLRGESG